MRGIGDRKAGEEAAFDDPGEAFVFVLEASQCVVERDQHVEVVIRLLCGDVIGAGRRPAQPAAAFQSTPVPRVVAQEMFARAWSGLSDAYEMLAYLAVLPPEEAHLRARAAAERALELDPDLAEAHVSLATVLLDYYRDWAAAERHYVRALALEPGYAPGRQLYAECLRDQGRFEEALIEIDEAIRLDPLSSYNRLVRSIVLCMARRYDRPRGLRC